MFKKKKKTLNQLTSGVCLQFNVHSLDLLQGQLTLQLSQVFISPAQL